MKLLSTLLLFILTVEAHGTAQSAFSEIRPLLAQIKSSSGMGQDKKSYGTAFVVDKSGLMITNYHVVADSIWSAKGRRLFTEIDDKTYEVSIKAIDFVNDLALISIDHNFDSAIVLAKKDCERGDEIFSLGLPEDVDWTVVQGVYNGVIFQGPYELVHMSSPINSGMSGGPTVNSKNELVGVNVSGLKDSQQISFSVPAKYVSALLSKYRKNNKPNDYLKALDEQLSQLQELMTKEIIDGFASPKIASGLRLPGRKSSLRCWDDSSTSLADTRYSYQGETCWIGQFISLAKSQFTGSYMLSTFTVKNLGLTDIAWQSKMTSDWNYMPGLVSSFDKNQKINFQALECVRERVAHLTEGVRTIRLCMQKIIPMTDLYDSYLMMMIPVNSNEFIHFSLNLSGFSKENIKKIVKVASQHLYIEKKQ